MILLVDNYDSFTYNLAQIIGKQTELEILRNDDPRLHDVAEQADGIIFSPGPGRPDEAGEMENIIRKFAEQKPMLGICLGHQAIGEVFGATVVGAKQIMHGKTSQTKKIVPSALLVDDDLQVMRYHSLVVDATSDLSQFIVTDIAADDQEIMAMKHVSLPIFGFQFHPESIGTPKGAEMITNFIELTSE